MTTPQSVMFTLECERVFLDDLMAEDGEVFDGRGHDSLIRAKRLIKLAIKEMRMVDRAWRCGE